MRGVPDGYLDRRDFVRAVGERGVPGWDGTEERAWPLSAYADFVAAIGETEAAVVYQIRVQSGIDQARAAPAPPAAKASPCANYGAPSTKIMDGRPYCDAHGTQPPIPERLRALMAQDPPIARMRTAEMAEAGREILSADAKRIHQPERLARERWNRAEAAVRDLVLAGKIRPYAFCLGDLFWPSTEEWRAHYRSARRELRVDLPSLPGSLFPPRTLTGSGPEVNEDGPQSPIGNMRNSKPWLGSMKTERQYRGAARRPSWKRT